MSVLQWEHINPPGSTTRGTLPTLAPFSTQDRTVLVSMNSNPDNDLEGRCRKVKYSISEKILARKRVSSRQNNKAQEGFWCSSDLEEIWDAASLEAIFYPLSKNQQDTVKSKLLLFISFLIQVDVDPHWFGGSRDRLFHSQYESSESTLKFTDDHKPRSEDELLRLGLNPLQAARWNEQYWFRPAHITLESEASDRGVQEVDGLHPLPFQVPSDPGMPSKIYDRLGDTTSGAEHLVATVRVRTCNQFRVGLDC